MSTLTGTGLMARLALRRSWLFWLLWILGLATLMPLTATQYDTILPPGTDPRPTLEPLRHNPSMLALLGPAFDLYTKGGFVFWRVGGFCSMFAGMLGALAIIRTTRGEEEEGRHELLRSAAVGRHAPLAAALLVCLGGASTLGVVAAALAAAAGLPTTGALAAGAALTTQCLLFVGLGAVCAQLFESSRSARACGVGVLWGGMFVLRMMVDGAGPDASYGWLQWAIPMEWGMLARPWADERWRVLAPPLVCFVICSALAFRLESVRDHGAGLRQARPGPAHAPGWLGGAFGLAWRLQRGTVLGWGLSLVLAALGMGSIMSQMEQTLARNPQLGGMLQKMGGTANLRSAFYLAMIGILATVAAIMSATLLRRLRSEEVQGHAESLLSTATSRWRLALSHLVMAGVAPAFALLAVGAAMPVAQARQGDDWGLVTQYLRTAAGLLPGLLLVTGLAMLLIGWLPRLTALVWAVLGWSLFCTWFAALFDLPRWLVRLQPWGHLAHLPRDPMDWTAFAAETALAFALMVLGLVGYRRRNIPA